VFRPLARLPRSVLLLGGAYLALVTFVATGLHHALDQAIAAPIWQDAPCWVQQASAWASMLFAAEVSLVCAVALALLCWFTGRPLTGFWIVFVLIASVGVELAFKTYFEQPAPSEFFATLSRPLCREPGPGYPLTIVPTPSSLPSGYSIRAAYFCLLAAALVGARWPSLRRPAWISLTVLAVVFGMSRVVVSWHWPSDVVAGLLLGAMGALVVTAQANGFAWLGGQAARSAPDVAASRASAPLPRQSPPRR
jgi:membrane-associated phospholipid phosphatase